MIDDDKPRRPRGRPRFVMFPSIPVPVVTVAAPVEAVVDEPDAIPEQQAQDVEQAKASSDKLLDALKKNHPHGYGNYPKKIKGA